MTLVLIANAALAVAVLAGILGLAIWTIRGSHHEGRPVASAGRRVWHRHTITLGHGPAPSATRRPFPAV